MLSNEARQIISSLQDSGGEITPEIEAMLEVNEKQLATKVDSYYMVMETFGADAEHWKGLKQKIDRLVKSITNSEKRLKENIITAMRTLDAKTLEGEMFAFTLANTKGKVDVYDEDQLPTKYLVEKVSYEVDKNAIAKDLADGIEIPGARMEQTYSLRKKLNKRSK